MNTSFTLAADPVIDRLAVDALKAWDVPGVTVVIVKDGKPFHIQAYGVRELGKPEALTPDDIFPLASCTKAFTAALVVKLGITDDPVRKHLPDYRLSDPNANELVTIRDLLTHRTGVNGHDLLWYHAPWDRAETLKKLAKLPMNGVFRQDYQYSTLQYMAAGQAAANAGKTPWEQLIREAYTDPLGMKSATFSTNDPAFLKSTKSMGHSTLQSGKLEVIPRYEIKEPNPAGSINLAPSDIAPWLRYQLRDAGFGMKMLIQPNELTALHTPQIVIPFPKPLRCYQPDTTQLSYALGWIVMDYRGLKVLTHGGIIDGFRNQLFLLPDSHIGIAIFSNRQDTKLPAALGNAIIDHLLSLPPRDWNAVFLKAVADEKAEFEEQMRLIAAHRLTLPARRLQLEKYAGTYANDAYGTAKLSVNNNELLWEWSSFKTPVEYYGDEMFQLKTGLLKDRLIGFRSTAAAVEAMLFEKVEFKRKN